MPVNKKNPTRVLIVEDEPVLALTLEELLVDGGFEVVGTTGKLEKALTLIGSAVFDVAIIDANLAGVSAGPAATALTARELPFIVVSGYSPEQLQPAFHGGVFIRKPYRPDDLFRVLKELVP